MSKQLLLGTLVLIAIVSQPVFAHRTGEGYIFIHRNEASLTGRVELPLEDLSTVLPLDRDGSGDVSDEEFLSMYNLVEDYARERIAVGTALRDFELQYQDPRVKKHTAGRFAVLPFVVPGLSTIPDLIEAEYRVLFDAIPEHRGFLVVERNVLVGLEGNEAIPSAIFSPGEPRKPIDLTVIPTTEGFVAFVRHGIWHIWIGIDHVLFVLALVMVSVLRRSEGAWTSVPTFTPALINVAKVITLFTVAHTVTLSLAALGFVGLSPRFVESVIALSVVAAALNNIRPLFGDWKWVVVFGFGLFHGFGLASVLGDLTLNQSALALTLLGFNLGVEIGQLAIVVAAFPLLYLMRMSTAYTRVLVPVGSGVIALIAAVWFVQRVFEIG